MNIKRLLKQIRAFFPSALPNGLGTFNAWAESFSEIYVLPTQDQDSIKYALATMILHLGDKIAYRPKHTFYLMLKAAAAKQVAGAAFQEIKARQQEAAKLAAEVKTNETIPLISQT
jgi:hypothetical protein